MKVEDYLNQISYKEDKEYIPSTFALEFINFIKLVNGSTGEENKTPVVHYRMLDQIQGKEKDIVNMCSRGFAKTTLLGEYLMLYIAVYGGIQGFGKIPLGIYVSDSIENGIKNMRKNLEYRWENSEFLRTFIPDTRFTDIRWEFKNVDGVVTIFKGYGAKALSLDSVLYTESGTTTIGDCKVGDLIYSAKGKLTAITDKSEIFNKPMYELLLADGRTLKVSEDHINSVVINTNPNNVVRWEEKHLTTLELLNEKLIHTKLGNKNHSGTSSKALVFIKNCLPLQYSEKPFKIDPYTLGLILGDGSVKAKGSGIVITGLKEDYEEYIKHIPYELGVPYLDKRTKEVYTWAVKGINQQIRDLDLIKHGDYKFIPIEYFYGSISQRLSLLQGLLDTDGSIYGKGRISFYSNSPKLCEDVGSLVRSLGGKAHIKYQANNSKQFTTVEIWINMCPFKLPRKANRFICNRHNWDKSALVSITPIANEPSQCIAIACEEKQFITTEYFRTHNTGVRGARELAQRPYIAILDDLISDDDARSPTVISSVEDTVYNAIDYALHPNRRKTIWSGTPFNSRDPLYKAVESGAWTVNVFPVCEQFPCTKAEFRGAWEDRFPYEYVKAQYDKSLKAGRIHSFNQELMLRIMSDEDRLITDSDIRWFKREDVLNNKGIFNFYITTDFATSEKTSSDYSFISVWAYNANGDWFWIDGVCKKQLMDKNIDDLFRLVQMYKPQQVGVEVTGQQGGFIPWLNQEMMKRNVWFTLASDNNSSNPGIRPNTNKMQRFNIVVPWFKTHKIFFPEEMKLSEPIVELMDELRLASPGGFKSKHDDGIDTISQLASMTAWKPSEAIPLVENKELNIWQFAIEESKDYNQSYFV